MTTQHATTGRLCAICDGTNLTTRLCPECRADPANRDWVERWDEIDLSEDLDVAGMTPWHRGGWQPGVPRTIGDLIGEPLDRISDHEQQILLLLTLREQQTFQRFDQDGRFRGVGRRSVGLSQREIAERVGCSQPLVAKVARKLRAARDLDVSSVV